jgi:hypothetical protein
VLPAVVKPYRLPMLSDHMRRCDLFDLPEEAARQRFQTLIAKRDAPSAPRVSRGSVMTMVMTI